MVALRPKSTISVFGVALCGIHRSCKLIGIEAYGAASVIDNPVELQAGASMPDIPGALLTLSIKRTRLAARRNTYGAGSRNDDLKTDFNANLDRRPTMFEAGVDVGS